MTEERPDRRQLLAGLASAAGVAVAGCSALPWEDDEQSSASTFSRSEAASVLNGAVPTVDRPAPVEPAASALEDQRTRVDDLLADVPDELDDGDIPNGVVRNAVGDRRDSALEYREATVDATGADRYGALRTTRDARDAARASATTLAAIDADRGELVDELGDERRAVRDRIEDDLETLAYRGAGDEDGRLLAAFFYAELEDDLETATRGLEPRRWDVGEHSNVVDVGDGAGDLEFATATAAVWDHLTERFVAEIDESADLEPAFDDALAASRDRLDDVDLPDQDDDWLADLVDREVDQGFDQTLLWDAVRPVYRAEDGLAEARTAGRYGSGLAEALRFEHEYRAFDRVRERFEDGTLTAPESIDEIRSQRTAAIEAAESATDAVTRPSLGTARLAETLEALSWTDDSIRRSADGDPDVNVTLGDEYSEYACLEARFEVLPDAVETFRAWLLED